MDNERLLIDQHVGELLSGFIDGELAQQQRQQVNLHCQGCEECRENLADIRKLRERIGTARLSEIGVDEWRENMNDSKTQTSRSFGWLLFIAGILLVGGIGLFWLIFNDEVEPVVKIALIAVYGGLATLLYSVLRQRLIEHKTDKYKDVEV